MATENIKVNVNVDDGGSTKKVTDDAKALNKQLNEAVLAAQKALKLVADANKARSKSSISSQSKDTGMGAQGGNQDSRNYRNAKGIAGETGASARDFARQAEGLGGLVRLYATYAANIFAVSAAYSALSRAADTTNMIKGLDQLGAASGRNLGTLAKRLSEATDGAVSLRDAMTATAQATAGGMSGASLLRLTNIAKNASLALGVAMPDALSRLTRGVIKLEPELLDEIGIMVRVDTASANYARTLGKSVSALTDFEKRQAFANEVLKQGEEKFGAIEMRSNPYSKLTASLQNLTQSGLELVNKVLGPLVEVLASSPTALATALAGIALVLTKQAIPALGQWREGLKKSAEDSGEIANRIYNNFTTYQAGIRDLFDEKQLAQIAPQLNAVAAASKKVQDSFKDTGQRNTSILGKLVAQGGVADSAAIKSLETSAKRFETQAKNAAALQTAEGDAAAAASMKKAKAIRETTVALQEQKAAQDALNAAEAKASGGEISTNRFGSERWARERNLARADAQFRSADVLKNVADDTQVMGVVGAYRELKTNIDNARKSQEMEIAGTVRQVEGISKLRAAFVGVRGAAIIAATGVQILGAALQGAFAIIGIFITAATLLYSWASTNDKQIQQLSSSIDTLSESATGAANTMSRLSKVSIDKVFTVETINARATALLELSNAATMVIEKLEEANRKASGTNNFFDWISQAWDGDNKTKASKAFSQGLEQSIRTMQEGPAKKQFQDKVAKILDTNNFTNKNTFKILENLDDKDATEKMKAIAKAVAEVATEANNSASRVKELAESLAASSLAFDDVTKSLNSSTPMAKFANAIIADSYKIEKALKDPTLAIVNLKALIDNPKQMSLLGPQAINDLMAATPEIKKISDELSKAEAIRAKYLEKNNKLSESGADGSATFRRNEALIARAEAKIKELRDQGAELAQSQLNGIASEQFTRGAKIIGAEISAAFASAGLAVRKALSSVFTGENKVREDAAIQQAEIGVQTSLIKATYDQIKQAKLNELAIRENTARMTLASNNATPKQMELAADELNKAATVRSLISGKNTLNNAAKLAESTKEGPIAEGAREAFSTGQNFASFDIQLAKLGGQSQAVEVQKQLGIIAEQYNKKIKEQVDDVTKLNALELNRLETTRSLTDGTSIALVRKKQELEAARDNLGFAKEQFELDKKRDQLNKAESMGANRDSIANERKTLDRLQGELTNRRGESDSARQLANAKEIADTTIAGLNKEKEFQDQLRATRESMQTAALDYANQELTIRAGFEHSDERRIAQQQRILDITIEQNRVNSEQATLDADRANKLAIIEAQRVAAGGSNAPAEVAANLRAQEEAINTIYTARTTALQTNNSLKLQGIELTAREKMAQAELNELTKKQAEILNEVTSAADSLGKVFGDVGTSVGTALEEFTKSFQSREKLEKEHTKKIADIRNDPDLNEMDKMDEEARANKKYTKQREKEELGMYGVLTKGAKAMFGEKSALAKTFGAIEKAMHVAKLAMYAAEVVANWSTVGPTIAAEGAKNTVKGTGAILSALNAPFPINFVAGAAMALIVASLLGGGSGDVKMPGGITAEERQAVQGTGQTYMDGKLVDTGGGVLGDKTAQNEDIVNSIEKLEALTIDGIQVNESMLQALYKVELNTKEMAAALFKVQGLTGGMSGFGTTEKSNPGFMGLFASSTTILDTGIKAVEGAMLGAENIFKQYETVQKTSSGFLGIGKSNKINENTKDLPEQLGRDITTIFNDSISAAAEGISAVSGKSKEELSQSIVDALDLENFRISAKDLDGEELTDAILATVGESVGESLRVVAPFLEEFRQLGEGTYGVAVRVGAELNYVTDAFSFMGMSLKTLPNTVNAVNSQLQAEYDSAKAKRDAAVAALSQAEAETVPLVTSDTTDNSAEHARSQQNLTKAQEEAIEATNEYNAAQKKYNDAQYSNVVSNIRLSQSLIKAAGGIEKFTDKFDFYINNFMTEGERMSARIPLVISKLNDLEKQFPRLGIAAIRTRDDFVRVITSLDPNTQGDAIAGLLTIAPDIAAVTQELPDSTVTYLNGLTDALEDNNDATEKATQLTDKTRELTIRIMELEGDTLGALNERRKDELAKMTEGSRVLQERVWLLEDEQKAAKAIETIERRILELTGQSAALTAAKRAEELEGLSEAEVIRKKYVYALEDEENIKNQLIAAYNKEQTMLKTTVDRLKQATKSLKDFKDQLLLGDKSTLTPAQKYEEAKAQFAAVAAIVKSTGTSEEEIEARTEAIGKFPTAAQAFLEASKNYFASSDQYQSDFASVLSLTEDTNGVLNAQLTEAEKQLAASKKMVEHLEFIKNSGQAVADLLPKFAAAVDQRLQAGFAAVAAGSTAAANAPGLGAQYGIKGDYLTIGNNNYLTPSSGGQGASWTQGPDGVNITTIKGMKFTGTQLVDWITQQITSGNGAGMLSLLKEHGFTMKGVDALLGIAAGTTEKWAKESMGIQAFAKGGYMSGMALVGEDGPEVVDFDNPGRVYTAEQTAGMFTGGNQNARLERAVSDLTAEVIELRKAQKVLMSQLIVATYDASQQNATQVVEGTKESANQSQWRKQSTPALK